MTAAQRLYLTKAIRDNPGWTVRAHPSAKGTVIVEVGDNSRGRWHVEGLVRLSPDGEVKEWSQR